MVAAMAMMLFALVPPSAHPPELHQAAVEQPFHDHGDHGHSHDDFDTEVDSERPQDQHHHADHSHEKLGLAFAASRENRGLPGSDFIVEQVTLVGNPVAGIDRPPRPLSLA